jgi:hypothetical protein
VRFSALAFASLCLEYNMAGKTHGLRTCMVAAAVLAKQRQQQRHLQQQSCPHAVLSLHMHCTQSYADTNTAVVSKH